MGQEPTRKVGGDYEQPGRLSVLSLVQPLRSSDTLEVRSRTKRFTEPCGWRLDTTGRRLRQTSLTTDRVDRVGFPSYAIAVESQKGTTEIGYRNHNDQVVIQNTGLPGTDHNQIVYVLRCERCHNQYGSNGSDIHLRKCPNCQGGMPGPDY